MWHYSILHSLSTDSTNSPCTGACQDILTNITINADPTSSYTTMIDTSTLLHDVGHTDISTITPTTTLLIYEISADQRVSSTVAPHKVTSNTPLHVNQATSTTLEVVSDKPSSSIKHQVEQSNLIASILTPSIVIDLAKSTSGLNAGKVTSILTPSLVLEESDMSESTSGLSVGTIAGIAVAAAFLLALALISVIFIAYRRWRWHHGALATTKGKHKILVLICLRIQLVSIEKTSQILYLSKKKFNTEDKPYYL